MIGASGREAEKLALRYLLSKGFEPVRLNYRTQEGEIDLIVKKENLLVFVEVKATERADVDPSERVDEVKRRRLLAAAERFLAENPWDGGARFDLVLVSPWGITHVEDAFRG